MVLGYAGTQRGRRCKKRPERSHFCKKRPERSHFCKNRPEVMFTVCFQISLTIRHAIFSSACGRIGEAGRGLPALQQQTRATIGLALVCGQIISGRLVFSTQGPQYTRCRWNAMSVLTLHWSVSICVWAMRLFVTLHFRFAAGIPPRRGPSKAASRHKAVQTAFGDWRIAVITWNE